MNRRELKRIVRDFRIGILSDRSSEMMCLAVCAPLHGFLSFLNIETQMVEGEVEQADYNVQHFWLRLPDGAILDPTADQFQRYPGSRRMPQVYIGERPAFYFTLEEIEEDKHELARKNR